MRFAVAAASAVLASVSLAAGLFGSAPAAGQKPAAPDNPKIDMTKHLQAAMEAAEHRESRRIGEEEFLRMSREPGTIVLDARSREKYDLLHIKGAVHLSFPDITVESLKAVIPDKTTRILIYCNNNFRNAEAPFPTKLPPASLNLSTYVTLYIYGYRNVYELAPLLDPASAKLEFESAPAKR